MGGRTVLADAQFGTARILRPFDGFASVYQGVTVARPIMLTEVIDPEGGDPLDPAAQERATGYASNLVRGVPVPFGSRVVLWLPALTNGAGVRYEWQIMWRLRNVYDYRNFRNPYHYPKQGEGVPDTTPGTGGARVVIPAAWQTLPYSETPQPSGVATGVVTGLRTEYVSNGSSSGSAPLIPGGSFGAIQQGIANPNLYGAVATQPLYQVHEVQAVGDEFLIGLTRGTNSGAFPNWTFSATTADEFLSVLLGSNYPDVGVYVMTGSAP